MIFLVCNGCDINLRLFCHLSPWPIIAPCSSLLVEIWFFHVVFSLFCNLYSFFHPASMYILVQKCKMRGYCLCFLKSRRGNTSMDHSLWYVSWALCFLFSKAYFQMPGVTERFSDVITIQSFLKAFQAKVFFQSLCCALSRVSISTLASIKGYVTW